MPVSCEYCVLLGTRLCDGPITRTEESYRVCDVAEYDFETSTMTSSRPTTGHRDINRTCCLLPSNFQSTFLRFVNNFAVYSVLNLAVIVTTISDSAASSRRLGTSRNFQNIFLSICEVLEACLYGCTVNLRCLYCDVVFHGKKMLTDAGNPLPFLLVCTEKVTALGRMC
jgi:hypothetical protein